MAGTATERQAPKPGASQPTAPQPANLRGAANDNAWRSGLENASISSPVSPQAKAILAGMNRAHTDDANAGTGGYPRMAQADTGNASDAEPPLPLPQPQEAQQTRPPEPVPNSYRKGKPWPPIPNDWIGRDHLGNPVLTRQASAELDAYRAQMLDLANQLERTKGLHVGLGQGDDKSLAAGLLKQYLTGDKDQVTLAPSKALREAPNVASAVERMQAHVMDWLVNPNKKQQPGEQIVPKILALKDGESVTVPSKWAGATTFIGDTMAALNSNDAFGALGHVQVDGDCIARVTRKGDRFLITVTINNTLKDRYDFTDADGQAMTNWYLGGGDRRSVEFGKLALLAETGRAKPFSIASQWTTEFTAELAPTRPAGRVNSTNRFSIQEPRWRLLSDRSDVR